MNISDWMELELAAKAKALELMDGAPAAANIEPTLELVKAAWALGYDVVRRVVPNE